MYYPVLATTRVAETAEFYVRQFGYRKTFEADWYVSLRRGSSELAVLDCSHPTIPEPGRRPVSGLLLNFEVEDVDAEYEPLVGQAGLPVLLDLRSEPWGQRHFITADPNGVFLDVITVIPPSEEFLAEYAPSA